MNTDKSRGSIPVGERFAVGVIEAGELLGVRRSKIYTMIEAGELPSRKIGRRRLILVDGIRAYLANSADA